MLTYFFISLLLLTMFVCIYFNSRQHHVTLYETKNETKSNVVANKIIPKEVILTIKDRTKIPPYIYKQYYKYARDYNLKVFDDNDCINFLRNEYGNDYVKKFNNIELGAHKADFFRYAYLYKYGGIYCDVKTLIMKDFDDIFTEKQNKFYMVYTFTDYPNNRPMIYNGIIATYPKNPYIGRVLQKIYRRNDFSNYHSNLIDATEILKEELIDENIHIGNNKMNNGNFDVVIFEEDIRPRRECAKLDRWGFCTFIKNENGEKVFRVRDPNYTTNYE